MNGPKYCINETTVLALYCERCEGEGVVGFDQDATNPERDCEECDGMGAVLTTDGAQILALVNDFLIKKGK